ncbi:MAG: trehalose-6-phosphate synthase [Alphaproteobacteria bacterium]|nr:trehalose-6-phosphate synthase [Alphaproteobacteria bacterium]
MANQLSWLEDKKILKVENISNGGLVEVKLLVRFGLPLIATIILTAFALIPFAEKITTEWFIADVRMRSQLIFSSIEDNVREALQLKNSSRIQSLFSRVAEDKRVIGLAYCGSEKTPIYKSKAFPEDYSCDQNLIKEKEAFDPLYLKGGSVLIANFPLILGAGEDGHKIVIAHDLSFIDRREETTTQYAAIFLFVVCGVVTLITVLVARITLSGWTRAIRDYLQRGVSPKGISRDIIPLIRDIQKELRGLEKEYLRQRQEDAVWTDKNLQSLIQESFPSTQVLVASFREPITHCRDDKGSITEKRNVNGLVTAMEPVVKACSGTWIAIGIGQSDGKLDRVKIEEFGKHYFLKRIRQSSSDYESFYHGICSGGIYPLCCSMGYIKPHFCERDWLVYIKTNQMYADAIIEEAQTESPIVLVQDYQLALVPRMVKEKLPKAIVVTYWHIPWPNSEIFSILPWGKDFLDGILASDIIGMQTAYMCNNFFDVVRANLEARVDMEMDSVERFGHHCLIRAYPVSIEWPLERLSQIEPTDICRKNLREELGIPLQNKVFLGVERMDFVKGIPERLSAFHTLLREKKELHGKVNFIQIAALSPRKDLGVYTQTAHDVQRICTEINQEFATKDWTPVYLRMENHSKEDIYRLYRATDICVVSSLHDGMNLVAKEFIAARDDELGVVIISRFAGAVKELPHSIPVNPHDERDFVTAFLTALNVPENIQKEHMHSMREHLKHNNVFRWAGKILADAAILHKKQQLTALVVNPDQTDRDSALEL